MRKLGDSNPRYDKLANCWFQPLTQTSFPVYCTEALSLKCGCKGKHIFLYLQIFHEIFSKKHLFCSCLPVFLHYIFQLTAIWIIKDGKTHDKMPHIA